MLAVLVLGLIVWGVLSLLVAPTGFVELSLARWLHILSGIMWIGHLYFFNFVQVPSYAEMEAAARSEALRKLMRQTILASALMVVPIYLALGWAAVFYIQDFFQANWVVMVLVIAGGLMYSVGAVVYGLKRPNPIPKHFGFHEIFHALTVAAFFCHWVAALLVGLSPIPGSLGSV